MMIRMDNAKIIRKYETDCGDYSEHIPSYNYNKALNSARQDAIKKRDKQIIEMLEDKLNKLDIVFDSVEELNRVIKKIKEMK